MKPSDSLLNIIAPHHCLGCNTEGEVCCQNCLASIELKFSSKVCYICQNRDLKSQERGICGACFAKQNLDSINWHSDYKNDLASQIIKALKFENNYAAKIPISKGLGVIYPKLKLNIKDYKSIIVTAIPTANKRVRLRGWDQAKLIAKSFAKSNKLAYKSLLIRSSSFDQIGASKSQRAAASKKFFKPIRLSLIKDSTIILVDDVVTTGSTLDSAAKVLKYAGAKEVHAITFARQGLKTKAKA
jgi:competence protein ComFC